MCDRRDATSVSRGETSNKICVDTEINSTVFNRSIPELIPEPVFDELKSPVLHKVESETPFENLHPLLMLQAPGNYNNEFGHVNKEMNKTHDCTKLLSDEEKAMTKSVASAVFNTNNEIQVDNKLGGGTWKDILNAGFGFSDDECHNFNSIIRNSMEIKNTLKAIDYPSLLQSTEILIDKQHLVNNVSLPDEKNVVPGEENPLENEYASTLILNMHDEIYTCNISENKTSNNVYPDFRSANKPSDLSSNLNSSMYANLKTNEGILKNLLSDPKFFAQNTKEKGLTNLVKDSKKEVFEVAMSHDYGSLQCDEQNLGDKSDSSNALNLSEKGHIHNNLAGKTLNNVSMDSFSGRTTRISSYSDDIDTSITDVLDSEADPENASSFSCGESELSYSDEISSSSPGSSPSSNITDHSDDDCMFEDENFLSNSSSNNSVGSCNILDFNRVSNTIRVQNSASNSTVPSNGLNGNFRSLYKKRQRPTRKKHEQLEEKLVELQEERVVLKNQIRDLEFLTGAFHKIVSNLLYQKRGQE